MLGQLETMFQQQIADPLLYDNAKYTAGETLLYSLAFIAFVWLSYYLVRRLDIRLDRNFIAGWSGWILVMAGVRVLEDQQVLTSPMFITPFIDMVFIAIVFSLIIAFGRFGLLERQDGRRAWVAMPLVVFLPVAYHLRYTNLYGLSIIAMIFIVIVISLYIISRRYPGYLGLENAAVISAHMLDASATFVAIYLFSAIEKHIVPDLFIGMLGPAVMFPLKLAVLYPVLLLIDRYSEDAAERRYIKLMIYSLGLGTGLRDTIQVLGY